MIFVIGEILFDIFPNYMRLGGAPFNFAYHLKHFGYPVRFISRIGNDSCGSKILEKISAAGFNPLDIQIDDAHPTGTVQVRLNANGVPSFNIIPDVAYDYIEYLPDIHLMLVKTAKLLYFGTIVQRTGHGFGQLQQFLGARPSNCVSFCDINLRPDCFSDRVIEQSLYNSDILKLNTDELLEIKRIVGEDRDPPSLIRHVMAEYSVETVAVTKGHDGSELHTTKGSSSAEVVPATSIVDTVGAGDAYAAVLAMGLLEGWPPNKTLALAAAFASTICTIEGAIPASEKFYEPFRKQIRNGGL